MQYSGVVGADIDRHGYRIRVIHRYRISGNVGTSGDGDRARLHENRKDYRGNDTDDRQDNEHFDNGKTRFTGGKSRSCVSHYFALPWT